jgi:hypothetical protein
VLRGGNNALASSIVLASEPGLRDHARRIST